MDKDIVKLHELQIEKTDAMIQATTAFTEQLVKLNSVCSQILVNSGEQNELGKEILRKFDNGIRAHIETVVNSAITSSTKDIASKIEKTDSKVGKVLIGLVSTVSIIAGLVSVIIALV